MQIDKDCELDKSDCFNRSYSTIATLESVLHPTSGSDKYSVILSDGTAFSFFCNETDACNIWVDIDGSKKGKTTLGLDIFLFRVRYDKNRIMIDNKNDISGKACRTGNVFACTSWILNYDNADYINCEVTEDNPTCN